MFLLRSLRRGWSDGGGGAGGGLRALFRRPGTAFRKLFGDLTLRDTVRPVLVPCYDLATRGPFLFSRADAVETRAYDFRLRDVCAATCAGSGGSAAAVEARSCDGSTRIAAVGGGVALGNPTAAAITHVLNNKREFPLAAGVEDLLVVSIGSGEGEPRGAASTSEIVRIAAEGVADMVWHHQTQTRTRESRARPHQPLRLGVHPDPSICILFFVLPLAEASLSLASDLTARQVDQAVAMAFGHNRTSNYIRIQVSLALPSPFSTRQCSVTVLVGFSPCSPETSRALDATRTIH